MTGTCASLSMIFMLGAAHPWGDNNYEAFTPGVGARCGQVEAGIYRNSIKRPSVYGAWHWQWTQKTSLMLGAVTGYSTGNDPLPAAALVHEVVRHVEIVFVPPFEIDKRGAAGVIGLRVTW
jgi:hypothetical protein